ncbi:Nitroreductase [Hexamita inflata]|uniref:Nitroreductase n=1 Tax=Hexamita inflata TaxID=28002 RepID=A0AA86QL58_9EUKA|nr:Nitroreductase [Hexamita inflata]
MSSVQFKVSSDCINCNKCVDICLPGSLQFIDSKLTLNESSCMRCGHCFSICPTGAISLFGVESKTRSFSENPVLNAMQKRHSTRNFSSEPFSNEQLREMLQALGLAPSSMNARKTRFSVVNRAKLDQMVPIIKEMLLKQFPGMKGMLSSADPIFRGAPHLIIAVEQGEVSEDGIIALAEFEVLAAGMGYGTCNTGLFKSVSNTDTIKTILGIKDGETVTSCIVFGKPSVQFVRPVARPALDIEIQ